MKRKKRAFWALFLALALIFSAFGDGGGFVYAEEARAAEIQEASEELPEEKQEETEEVSEKEAEEILKEMTKQEPEEISGTKEQTKHVEYTASCGEGWEVHAEAETGALPDGAVLKAERLKENSEAFVRARETVEKSGVQFDGIAALDLHFEKDGQEVEPEKTVQVSVVMPDMIPTEESVEELVISHILEEEGETRAETVAALDEDGKGTASLEQENGRQVLRAEFVTESFSSYTITWQLGNGKTDMPKEISISLYAGTLNKDGSYEELGDVTEKLGSLTWYTADKSAQGTSVNMDEIQIPVNLPSVTGEDGKRYDASGKTCIRVADQWKEVGSLKMKKLKVQNGRQWYDWYVIYAAGDGLTEPAAADFQSAENVLYYGRKDGTSGWTETNKSSVNRVYLEYNTPAESLDPGTGSGGGAAPSLAHRKYLTRREDGSYDLTLEVTGQAGSVKKPKKLDVLLILDQSGSMTEDMNGNESTGSHKVAYTDSRWYNAKTAIQQLIDTLKANESLDVRYSIVAYSGTKANGAFQDAAVKLDWSTAEQFQISRNANDYGGEGILDYKPSGGTNYQAGLRTGKQQLAYARADAEKAVIFLSDGYPTFYYNENGMTAGHGSKDADGTDRNGNLSGAGNCSKAACAEAAGFQGVDYFYTIGLGKKDTINADTLKSLSDNVEKKNPNAVFSEGKKPYLCGDLKTLRQAFADMAGSITRLACTDVSIRDTLSENVTLLAQDGTEVLTLQKGDYQLRALDKEGKEKEVPEGTVVTYAADDRQMLLHFPKDYELQDGWTYRVTVHITPSDRAYEKYLERGASYQDADGKADVGGPDTEAHAGEEGFYSNDGASVTYTYRGQEWTEGYEMPVVQLQIGTLRISKTVTGNMAEQNREFPFTLKLIRDQKAFTTGLPAVKGQKTQQLTAREGSYTFSLKHGETMEIRVPAGWDYQIEEAENEEYTAYVTVGEKKEAEGRLAEGTTEKTVVSAAFRNHREVQVPTGVALSDLNGWLAALAVVGAGGGAMNGIGRYRRRRTHGERKS